jgi:hypothetical protein
VEQHLVRFIRRFEIAWIVAMALSFVASPSANAQNMFARQQAAVDQPITFLSLPLGSPFTVSKCEERKTGFAPSSPLTRICWRDMLYQTDRFDREILLPDTTWPSGITRGTLRAKVVDGVLVKLEVRTQGLDAQDVFLAALKEKFGAPLTLTDVKMQNRFGATFLVHDALWKTEGVVVRFLGAYDLDHGSIQVTTARYDAVETAEQEKVRHQAPKF